MGFAANQTLLHYRLVEQIGAGGMGVVWKAVDTALDREVAIKMLPDAFAADSERLARFRREAKLLASLNHPNIATIHGLHEAQTPTGPVRFLAMELIEGQDLAKHVAAGPVPLENAIDVARQVAEALEAAHENGIVHRDLKPANILVSSAGQVKVLDFGLAKPAAADPDQVDLSMSPTLTSAGTQAGMILGTAAYLSPEQAKGQPVDRRTDIWAFGVVLHELLTGRPTFRGEGISETLAAVILKDPDLEALPASTPPRMRELVRRCLIKNARNRLRDIGEARVALEEVQADPTGGVAVASSGPESPARAARRRWPMAVAAIVVVAAAFLAGVLLRPRAPEAPVMRLNVELSAEESFSGAPGPQFAISPDGTRIVTVTGDPSRLHVRSLDQLEDTVLSGTEGAGTPFFSPDGQWVAFVAGQKLKKVSINGGAPLTLADAGNFRGGTWGEDDSIVFAPETTSGLRRVSAAGGEVEELTTLEGAGGEGMRGERSHRWPHFLPGGRKLLFVAQNRGSTFNEATIELLDLQTKERTIVQRGGSNPRYVPGGFLVFAREGTLFATRFDPERGETRGSPVPVLEGVSFNPSHGGARFAYSQTGTMIYLSGTGADAWNGIVARVGADGTVSPLQIETGKHRDASLSPDGRFVAYSMMDASETASNIWVYDLERDVSTRLTFEEAWEWYPSWTPDGRSVTFSSERSGEMQLYRKPADGSREAEALTPGIDGAWTGGSWSPDGKFLIFTRRDDNDDLVVRDVDGSGEPKVFLKTGARELKPTFSPDGRWVVYQSDESGSMEVYVRPFPGPGGKWQVSQGGGESPTWSRDGKSLYFYRDEEGVVMQVPVTVEGDSLRVGRPREVLRPGKEQLGRWSVGADGTVFVTLLEAEEKKQTGGSRVSFVFGWPAELERMVP